MASTSLTAPPADAMAAGGDEAPLDLYTLFEPNEDCICEFGDVVLVINDGFHPVQKLRVSSCVLAMSSKVFKALFSKQYSEGSNGKDRSSSKPYEIELQDAPTPMKHLCRLLHLEGVSGSELEVSTLLPSNFSEFDCFDGNLHSFGLQLIML